MQKPLKICVYGLFFQSLAQAATPILQITPTTPTSMLLPANSIETIQYQVTNLSKATRTWTMLDIAGVTQTSEGCSNPFTLAPRQSCLLTLSADGSQIPSQISGGPVICKTQGSSNLPDAFLCARPELSDVLDISVIGALPKQQAYVTNWFGNSVSLCDVSSLDGSLVNCTITAEGTSLFTNPEAITLNPAQNTAYIANIGGNTVTQCALSATGTLENCALTGSTFNGPDGVVVIPAGTAAYVSNAAGNNVSFCQVDAASNGLFNCLVTGNNFTGPSDLAINPQGSVVYVSNVLAGSVSTCTIDSTTGLLDCAFKTFGFSGPEGITLHPSGQFAYVTNNGSNDVFVCAIDAITNHLHSCQVTNGRFNGFGNLAFNALGTRAYIPNLATGRVSVCSVNSSNGNLSRCHDSNGTGFNGPSGILLK